MQRKHKQDNPPDKIDLILCADLHLRETTPICRTDDYMKAQQTKLEYIDELSTRYNARIVFAGDIFDHWKPSPALLSFALKYLPEYNLCVPGQHDLPNHSPELMSKSGFGVLQTAEKIENDVLFNNPFFKYGHVTIRHGHIDNVDRHRTALVVHHMVWQTDPPFPGAVGNSGNSLLKKYPDYDLIVTGDNHIPFVSEYEGRILVNPGSVMRSTIAQIDYKPRVYLYSAEQNKVWPEYLPIEKNVISVEHKCIKEAADQRIQSFIENLKEMNSVSVSFEDNLRQYLEENKTTNTIQEKIWEAVG